MERGTALWIAGLLACTIHLTASLDKSFALDRPVHASVVVLTICGAALLLFNKIRPLSAKFAQGTQHYAPIPLSDLGDGHGSRPGSPVPVEDLGPEYRPRFGLKVLCALIAFLLSARIEILRQVVSGVECSVSTTETIVPIFIALADWWILQRHRRQPREQEDDMDSTMYSDLLSGMAGSQWRPLVAVVLLSWSSTAVIARASYAQSTYICSQALREYSVIPRIQVAGVVLDGLLSVLLYQLLDPPSRRPSNVSNKGSACLGLSCLMSAATWIIIGTSIYFWGPPYARKMISHTPMYFTSSAIKLAVVISLIVICALRSIHHIGMLRTSVLVLFASASTSLFLTMWNHSHPFPPLPRGTVFALTGMTIALVIYALPESSADEGSRASSRTKPLSRYWGFYPILSILYFFQLMLAYNGDDEVRYHPIDMLMYNAKERHDDWLKWASSSISVETAAANYTARYNRHPPPRFDEWYSYAASHGSLIIDDYDSIHEDLLPYWSLTPAEIRHRTWEAIVDPSKNVGGIFIRGGKAQIAPNVPRNQRGMLDGIVQMIEKFGKWLPDMDLAFNLNNECRVAVPYEAMETIRADAKTAFSAEKKPSELINDFTADRAAGWEPLPQEPHASDHFMKLSSQSTWDEFGSISCHPKSPARTQRLWNHKNYCASCALPHSLGAFFANWTLASDICHQPDLAHLHGFYTSPNTFIGTHRLLPIFSQSKAPGFNDILYPSAWNYQNRAAYAPTDTHPDLPYASKLNTLFWRGTSSEGFAVTDSTAWKGMVRQRLVALLSNASTLDQPLPLPAPIAHARRKLRYTPISAAALPARIPVTPDVLFADIARCADSTCALEEAAFPVIAAEHTDFQDHWRHRFLLDADGAGFSGRFFAFLASGSLPLKVAPLFREWWHGRVTPWLHFVPLDVRLQGVWPTVAFFAGFNGTVGGVGVEARAREKEGERIAREGAEWAGRVLRGEDMEVYLFRVLLEWGRVTDDERERLGFVAAPLPAVGV